MQVCLSETRTIHNYWQLLNYQWTMGEYIYQLVYWETRSCINVTSYTGTNRTYQYVWKCMHTSLQSDNVVVQSEGEDSGYDRIVQNVCWHYKRVLVRTKTVVEEADQKNVNI